MSKEKPVKRAISKLKRPLPSYNISFEKHFEIIKAYVVASEEGTKPVSWKDFQGLVDVSPANVSSNNKFLEDLGIINEVENKPGSYIPTPKAINLKNAQNWDEEETISIIRDLVSGSWFWQSARQLLSVHRKVTKKDLINKLGFDSGADPKKHQPSLEILIKYLQYAGLISEENEEISLGKYGAIEAQRKIKIPPDKDMIQISIGDDLYAIDIKEFEEFIQSRGKKLDRNVTKIK